MSSSRHYVLAGMVVLVASWGNGGSTQTNREVALGTQSLETVEANPLYDVQNALVRLPLAAILGAALALRPKRRSTPARNPAVVQTQIILAVVAAVIMLVVGASLARAFGIVGAATLIRYRSKIDDPKDAVVMLSTLAVGLASGVGLYLLATVSTVFLLCALWVIESFEPAALRRFELAVKMGNDTDAKRPLVESTLTRFGLRFDLWLSSDDELRYEVHLPLTLSTEEVSDTIERLSPGGASVAWVEKKARG